MMTAHADTIRRALHFTHPVEEEALDALLAERQQAIDERDRANEAFTAQADLRYKAEARCEQAIDAQKQLSDELCASESRERLSRARCEQAIDALRRIEQLLVDDGYALDDARAIARAALLSLGEQSK